MLTTLLIMLAITVTIDAIALTMLFNSIVNNKYYPNMHRWMKVSGVLSAITLAFIFSYR